FLFFNFKSPDVWLNGEGRAGEAAAGRTGCAPCDRLGLSGETQPNSDSTSQFPRTGACYHTEHAHTHISRQNKTSNGPTFLVFLDPFTRITPWASFCIRVISLTHAERFGGR
ncbi:unnamed protein product, partial [Ixodes pacificus]